MDRRPKFHLYKPHAAIISGIAWDHINVFPTFENYIEQFDLFCNCIEPNGTLVYNNEDTEVKKLGEKFSNKINTIPYNTPIYNIKNNGTEVEFENKLYSLKIFGEHNLQNVFGAMTLSKELGITPEQFLNELSDFQGAGKRLQKVVETDTFVMFKDFAHSPSKLMATTKAVKEQYPDRELVACMELHTFSSLKKEFLPHYENTMDKADHALVYFNPHVVEHKKLEPISVSQVKTAFGGDVSVVNETKAVLQFIKSFDFSNKVLLMMSSGTFDGINYDELGEELKQ